MVSGGYAHVFTLSYGVRQEVAVYGSLIFMVIGTGRRNATGRRGSIDPPATRRASQARRQRNAVVGGWGHKSVASG